ncbi:MAG: hypothetical protein JXR68_12240 [Bacteroidales bacterium]|nr:hypothetical protein [Bacteroidales bacterium]
MTKNQALEIINLLKQGKQHKTGHYQYGYTYYFYSDGFIIEIIEDLSVNIYDPSIRTEKICVDEFISTLIEKFDYEDFMKNLS